MMAQVRDIDAGGERRLQDGLAGREGNALAVDGKAVGVAGVAHASSPRWAAASSRPASSRARDRAASRSKAGTKSVSASRRS
ncbi:hypothetical protein SDC9_212862 [bioreactor metagenome]|uniref:Uncharacterized protein n=1 Tax=bioreactor metagenome TaxID=1076179 RepID=A0A645K1Z5_9ZZZZ